MTITENITAKIMIDFSDLVATKAIIPPTVSYATIFLCYFMNYQ